MVEDIGRADDMAEDFIRRRHGLRRGQVVDEFGQKEFFRRVFQDFRRVVLVNGLRSSLGNGQSR